VTQKFGIEPFIEATRRTFEVMLGMDVKTEEVSRGKGVAANFDVSGIVSLDRMGEANVCGSVVLSFSEDVARRAVGRVFGEEGPATLDQDAADAVGELINVVAGGAKRGLAKMGIDGCRVSLPTVILGAQHRVFRMRDVDSYLAGFSSDIGEFVLQVFLGKEDEKAPVELG